MAKKNTRKYTNAAQMQKRIESYFASCEPVYAHDANGEVKEGKNGPVVLHQNRPTVTGLALALGFSSRAAMDRYLNYRNENNEYEFREVLTRAKSIICERNEQMLYSQDTYRAAAFVLQNGFHWGERDQTPSEVVEVVLVDE